MKPSNKGGCTRIGCTSLIVLLIGGAIFAMVTFSVREIRAVAPFKDSKAQYLTACSVCQQVTQDTTNPYRIGRVLVVHTDGSAVALTMANRRLKEILATSPDEVGTLICVGDAVDIKTGSYTDSSGAYRTSRDICLIDMADGKVIFRTTLRGTSPPSVKRGSESGTGSDPIGNVLTEFILSLQVKPVE